MALEGCGADGSDAAAPEAVWAEGAAAPAGQEVRISPLPRNRAAERRTERLIASLSRLRLRGLYSQWPAADRHRSCRHPS